MRARPWINAREFELRWIGGREINARWFDGPTKSEDNPAHPGRPWLDFP